MVVMTVAAGKAGRFLRDTAMQLGNILHLGGDLGMTFETAVCHGGAFPWRGVTSTAFSDVRMRVDAAVRLAGLGIQFTCAEHIAATGKCGSNKKEQGNERSNKACTGKTSKTIGVVNGRLLMQEGGVIQRPAQMNKCRDEQCDADRNMNGVPE